MCADRTAGRQRSSFQVVVGFFLGLKWQQGFANVFHW